MIGVLLHLRLDASNILGKLIFLAWSIVVGTICPCYEGVVRTIESVAFWHHGIAIVITLYL